MAPEDDPRLDVQEEPGDRPTYLGDSLHAWWKGDILMLAVGPTGDMARDRHPIYFRPQSVERLRQFLAMAVDYEKSYRALEDMVHRCGFTHKAAPCDDCRHEARGIIDAAIVSPVDVAKLRAVYDAAVEWTTIEHRGPRGEAICQRLMDAVKAASEKAS